MNYSPENCWNAFIVPGQKGIFKLYKTPWAHQKQILLQAAALPNYALFCEPGTGKTLTTILLARFKMHLAGRFMKTLIITPGITLPNWKEEWIAGSPFNEEDVQMLVGTEKNRAGLVRMNPKAWVFIANYETMLMTSVVKEIKKWGVEILVCDESHKIKNWRAQRTKALVDLSDYPTVKHRYIMSGTPVLNSTLDIFSQYRVMEGPTAPTFGPNYFKWRGQWFVDVNYGTKLKFQNWQPKIGTLEGISKAIAPSSVSLKKSECLNLPPLVRKNIFVELSPEQAKMYAEMANDFVTYFEGHAVVAQMALTKLLRLMQIVSGFVKTEGENGESGVLHSIKNNPRQTALLELLKEVVPTGKVIVWANFRHNYQQIRGCCEALNLGYAQIHGEIGEQDKLKAITAFQRDPDISVLIGSPGSLSCGANLAIAPSSIFYSRSFSLEHSVQAEARTYRAGSEVHPHVTRYDIVAKGTVDELVAKRLANKEDISAKLLQAIALELRCSTDFGTGDERLKRSQVRWGELSGGDVV